jgi:hypothetical protein
VRKPSVTPWRQSIHCGLIDELWQVTALRNLTRCKPFCFSAFLQAGGSGDTRYTYVAALRHTRRKLKINILFGVFTIIVLCCDTVEPYMLVPTFRMHMLPPPSDSKYAVWWMLSYTMFPLTRISFHSLLLGLHTSFLIIQAVWSPKSSISIYHNRLRTYYLQRSATERPSACCFIRCLRNLLNVLVQIANNVGLKKTYRCCNSEGNKLKFVFGFFFLHFYLVYSFNSLCLVISSALFHPPVYSLTEPFPDGNVTPLPTTDFPVQFRSRGTLWQTAVPQR